jgi:hypothetical protein
MCYAQLLLTPQLMVSVILGLCKHTSGFSHNTMSVKQAHKSLACEQIYSVFNKYIGRQIMWMLFVTYHKSVPIPSLSTLEKLKNWTYGVLKNWVEMAMDRIHRRTFCDNADNLSDSMTTGMGLIVRIHDLLLKKERVLWRWLLRNLAQVFPSFSR